MKRKALHQLSSKGQALQRRNFHAYDSQPPQVVLCRSSCVESAWEAEDSDSLRQQCPLDVHTVGTEHYPLPQKGICREKVYLNCGEGERGEGVGKG